MLAFTFGSGFLLASWFGSNQKDEPDTNMEELVQNIQADLSGVEATLEVLSTDIQQLHITVNNNANMTAQSRQNVNQLPAVNVEANQQVASENLPSRKDIPTDREIASLTLIVDKLRAQDMNAYPDFPSLMMSPEVTKLGPAALKKMFAEIKVMFENGELSPSFFPPQ